MTIQVDLKRSYPRKFVPERADVGNWADVEPLFAELLKRNVASVDAVENWLVDYSELVAALWEENNRRHIAMTSQTDDPAREASYQQFIQEIMERCKPVMDAMERAYLENPIHHQLPPQRYELLNRKSTTHVELYREQNVQIETEEELLAKDYYKIMGAMTVPVSGKDLTPDQALKFLEEPDRPLRQRVWEQIAARRLKDKEEVEAIFDRLVALRTEIAANADYANYRDY